MKRKKLFAIMLTLGLLGISIPVQAATCIQVNGQTITISEKIYIKDGRTFVPLRAIGELMGARIEWEPNLRGAWILIDGGESLFVLDDAPYEKVMSLAKEKNVLWIGAEIKNGRMYLPLRQLAESTGYKVDWTPTLLSLQKPVRLSDIGYINRTLVQALQEGYVPKAPQPMNATSFFPDLPENALLTDQMLETLFGALPLPTYYKLNLETGRYCSDIHLPAYDIYVQSGHMINRTLGNTTISVVPRHANARAADTGYIFRAIQLHDEDLRGLFPSEPNPDGCFYYTEFGGLFTTAFAVTTAPEELFILEPHHSFNNTVKAIGDYGEEIELLRISSDGNF